VYRWKDKIERMTEEEMVKGGWRRRVDERRGEERRGEERRGEERRGEERRGEERRQKEEKREERRDEENEQKQNKSIELFLVKQSMESFLNEGRTSMNQIIYN
jgi:hypothetical protein